MDTYSLFTLGGLVLSFVILFILFQILRILIINQIDDQIKNMIPIKAIRKRVGIRIKLK